MKPNNNHRWNRCRTDEDYCLTFGHGEQFFRAFDKAFNLQQVTAEMLGHEVGASVPSDE